MNNGERTLIRYVCDGDMRRAQMQARCILGAIKSQRDADFRDEMIRRIEMRKNFVELPDSLKGILAVDDSNVFHKEKFLVRKTETEIVEKTISIYRAAERLVNIGIHYPSALMLHGESGCGKTELARYIAHRAELPFAYVRFSSVVDSHLGGTQSNIAKIFEYVSTNPCVLCFDEIDAIGMARGQEHEIGEMSRVVIAVMQELDRIPNNAIIIGTTNRFDQLDPALVRRFPLRYEIMPLSYSEVRAFAHKFFEYAGMASDSWVDNWCDTIFEDRVPASTVVKECTDVLVKKILGDSL